MPPPPGPQGPPPSPAFVAEDQSSSIFIACGICMAVVVVFFSCRMVSRRITKVGFKLSDGVLLAGIVFYFAVTAVYIYTAKHGVGRHSAALAIADPSMATMSLILKTFFVATLMYFASIALIKLSIIAVYYELFGGLRYRRTLWALAFIVVGWWLAFTIQNIFGCRPISVAWDPLNTPDATCINAVAAYYANGVINVLTDAALVLLPVRIVWTMQLTGQARLALTFVFFLGIFVCVASAVRLAQTSNGEMDFIWGLVVLEVWSQIELCVAIVCACLLCSRPLFAKLVPQWISAKISARVRSRTSQRYAARTPKFGPLARASRATPQTGGVEGPAGVRLDMYPSGAGPTSEVRKGSSVRTFSEATDSVEAQETDEKTRTIKVTRGFAVNRDVAEGKREGETVEGSDAGSLNGASTKELFPKQNER